MMDIKTNKGRNNIQYFQQVMHLMDRITIHD